MAVNLIFHPSVSVPPGLTSWPEAPAVALDLLLVRSEPQTSLGTRQQGR